MILDCVPFFQELDILEIRLRELSAHVDRFILVEGDRTHSGQPKSSVFQANRLRFAPWQEKITAYTVALDPDAPDAWVREAQQRAGIIHALADVPDDALVLVSDVDEIPRADVLPTLPTHLVHSPVVVLEQTLYYYDWTYRSRKTWHGTRAARAATVRQHGVQWMRTARGTVLTDAGWHMSYYGDVVAIQRKMQSFAHQEYNTTRYTDPAAIAQRIAEGRDPYDRAGMVLDRVVIDESYPLCVQEGVCASVS